MQLADCKIYVLGRTGSQVPPSKRAPELQWIIERGGASLWAWGFLRLGCLGKCCHRYGRCRGLALE